MKRILYIVTFLFLQLNGYAVTVETTGFGWNYAWYRDKKGQVKEIFPESKSAPNYKFRTNWITFYK